MTFRWRRHQREALDAIAAQGGDRSWVVLPPGAGKTLVGVGAAAAWGDRVVAFGPNVAIVSQWRDTWTQFTGDKATSDRSLPTRFTALTYQSLAVFDADSDQESPLTRLHPNGQALIKRLRDEGPITLILDECHHLMEVWGDLLDEVIADLPQARVLALTATPPELLTPTQAARVQRLFGDITYQATIPAVIAEGDLVPVAELAWFTQPTPREDEWLNERQVRAVELVTELTRVDVSLPLASWVSFLPWDELDLPMADAIIRLAQDEIVPLPAHAHVAERHRRPADLNDWLTVASEWLRSLAKTGTEDDADYLTHIARLLPGVGYRWTRHGIRRGQPLVDRVLSRSASKTQAAADIAAFTLDDPQARLIVLTDVAVATTLPADLTGVVEPQSGSARWLLETFAADERLRASRPIMVTGTSIGGDAATLRELLPADDITGNGVVVVEGASSARWLEAATAALNAGWTRCLIGTRGLLGEGWDARSVTGVIDLTSATTSTAIVQTRGRSLRVDPNHPDKVAVNWTVTCVAPDRPNGDADYQRLMRKHDGWFAVDAEGAVVDGVAHLDARLSPDIMPDAMEVDELNHTALDRATDHDAIRTGWASVDPTRTQAVATVRITAERTSVASPRPKQSVGAVTTHWALMALAFTVPLIVAAIAIDLAAPVVASLSFVVFIAVTLFALKWFAFVRTRQRLVAKHSTIVDYARAVADGLQAAGLSTVGAAGVRAMVTVSGETRVWLDVGDESVTVLFSEALAEVLNPIEQPRYLISRPMWDHVNPSVREVLTQSPRAIPPDRLVWHQVPRIVGVSRARADVFAQAWSRHIGVGHAVYTGTPEGIGLLRAWQWSSPLGEDSALRIVHRRHW